jgi:hypothetical protein
MMAGGYGLGAGRWPSFERHKNGSASGPLVALASDSLSNRLAV